MWAVGGATPDAVDINLGKNCLDVRAKTIVAHRGASAKDAWRFVAPQRTGFLFGVDILAAGRAVAVGTSLRGETLRPIAEICGAMDGR